MGVETYYALLMCCISVDAECTRILSSHIYTQLRDCPTGCALCRMYRLRAACLISQHS